MRKNAKANTVTTIFTTKAHAEIELSTPENAQMGAAAQAYSAFSPVNSIIYIWNHNFPCLCWKIVLYFATSKGSDKIVSLPLHMWDIERNLPLTPDDVAFGSHKRVWWTCPNGHSWQAMVYTRSEGTGCPYCTGRKVTPKQGGLVKQFPLLAAEWDVEKNAPLTPQDVTTGSHKLIWWRCPKGHSYRSAVKTRAQGSGCPYCAGKNVLPEETSLAAEYPTIAKEWDAAKNVPLLPTQVISGTRRKVWWLCPKGHSWRAAVFSRTTLGTGCPVCTGRQALAGENDLATLYPDIAAQWDEEKNGALHPSNVTAGSNRRVWWRCEKGHSYRAVIAQRVQRGDGCPYCANRKVLPGFNDLATAAPLVAKQWHETLNGALTPEMVTAGSHKKAWWQCSYGHVWKAAIYSRAGVQQCGCPVCAGKTKRKTK